MELTTLSPSHTHRHPPPSNEEDQNQMSTSPPAPPPSPKSKSKSKSKSKTREATSLLSRLRTWWSNNIRLVIVVHSPAEPIPSSAEGQAQAQAQAQAQPQDQDQDQPKFKDPTAEEKAVRAQPEIREASAEGEIEPDHRDFLALERTFLAYVRTSMSLVSFGVIVTQLYVLQKVGPTVGVAVGGVCDAGGMVIVLVGCVRYFRQQKLLAQGKTVTSGWDLLAVLMVLGGLLLAIFVVVLIER